MLGDRQNACLPLDRTLLPQVLKKNGYKTHVIGKYVKLFFSMNVTVNLSFEEISMMMKECKGVGELENNIFLQISLLVFWLHKAKQSFCKANLMIVLGQISIKLLIRKLTSKIT